MDELAVDGRMPEIQAARVARDIMQMVAQCHAMGVIHRDIKPGTVMASVN